MGIIEFNSKSVSLTLSYSQLGLDSQAALSMCSLLRKIAQKGLAILCSVSQPSARLLQSFDRLMLLGEGGKQLYFGKIGPSGKTMVNYFERNGARSCNTDENPAEWMLEVTGSVADSHGSKDWQIIWSCSPECKAVKSKLSHLKEKFADPLRPIREMSTPDTLRQSVVEIDAIDLQREFRRFFV